MGIWNGRFSFSCYYYLLLSLLLLSKEETRRIISWPLRASEDGSLWAAAVLFGQPDCPTAQINY